MGVDHPVLVSLLGLITVDGLTDDLFELEVQLLVLVAAVLQP